MTQALATEVTEELLEAEIPCGGIVHKPIARSCTHSAAVMSRGHGCPIPDGAAFKCVGCWQAWYKWHADHAARWGCVRCGDCNRHFPSVEAFSDYRAI